MSHGATALRDSVDPYRDWPDAPARDAGARPRSDRLKRLAIAVAIPMAAFLVVIRLMAPPTDVQPVRPFDPPTPTPQAAQDVVSDATSGGDEWRSYALEITELDGLAPDAPPGALLEIWVTWEPPVTRRVRMQKLIREARLEKIIPNIVPEGPATALLSIRSRDIADIMYGDRFGELSAAILPSRD